MKETTGSLVADLNARRETKEDKEAKEACLLHGTGKDTKDTLLFLGGRRSVWLGRETRIKINRISMVS